MSSIKFILVSGCCLGALSVILGAFAAHGLKSTISTSMLDVFQTGVRYQAFHALALLFVGLISLAAGSPPSPLFSWVAILFLVGVALFSGSLYSLALGAPRWFGAITPLGGMSFIGGWLLLTYSIATSKLT